MDVSENRGTPKSSILIGFSILNYPFWGARCFWKHPYDGQQGNSPNFTSRSQANPRPSGAFSASQDFSYPPKTKMTMEKENHEWRWQLGHAGLLHII